MYDFNAYLTYLHCAVLQCLLYARFLACRFFAGNGNGDCTSHFLSSEGKSSSSDLGWVWKELQPFIEDLKVVTIVDVCDHIVTATLQTVPKTEVETAAMLLGRTCRDTDISGETFGTLKLFKMFYMNLRSLVR